MTLDQHTMFTVFVLLIVFASVVGDSGPLNNEDNENTTRPDYKDKYRSYRLPTTLKPIEYTISLVPFVGINTTFDGHVEILFKVIEATSEITLHKTFIAVTETTLTVRDPLAKRDLKVNGTREVFQRDLYVIFLEEAMVVGREYHITMDYVGRLNEDDVGLYVRFEEGHGLFAATYLEPVYARMVFPCFDEPAMKAVFKIKISRPGNMFSISNMPKLTEGTKHMDTPDDIGRFWDEFAPTPIMSTYLIAIVISNFPHISDKESKLRIFSPTSQIAYLDYALRITPQIRSSLHSYTGVSDVMPKIDFVSIPSYRPDGMESWGLVAFRDIFLMVGEDDVSEKRKQEIAYTIGHEMAHSWFGNLVTLDWWEHLWLNEGFAVYVAYVGLENVEKSWRMDEMFLVHHWWELMEADSYHSAEPITIPVSSPLGIEERFNSVTYDKGGCVVRMMTHILSPETFQAGIHDYLDKRRWESVTPDILYSILNKKYNKHNRHKLDLKAVMTPWTSEPGYPVVHVRRDYGHSIAHVTQERFLDNRNQTVPRVLGWFVPLTFTTGQRPNFMDTRIKQWLDPNTTGSSVIRGMPIMPNQWVLFNVRVVGMYRVNYDLKNWDLLIDLLNSDKFNMIPPVNRAQLIDDSFSLALAGYITNCVPLSILRYLSHETDYVPLSIAFKWFKALSTESADQEYMDLMKSYLLSLVSPIFKTFGMENKKTDDHIMKMTRELVVERACALNHTDCLSQAKELFQKRVTSGETVDPNVRQTVYCTALREEYSGAQSFLLEILQNKNTSQAEKKTILSAMSSCLKREENILEFDEYVEEGIRSENTKRTKSRFRPRNTQPAKPDISNTKFTNDLELRRLDLFLKHHKEIMERMFSCTSFGEALSMYLPRHITGKVVNKLRKFMRKLKSHHRNVRNDILIAIVEYEHQRAWHEFHGADVVRWLKAELNGTDKSRRCSIVYSMREMEERGYKSSGHPTSSLGPRVKHCCGLALGVYWIYRLVLT